ncbi:MAG: hypothetical protein ACJ72H_15305 [Candidatus Sulfotelmatobacter sp.]
MTLMVFLGVLVSLLILRLVPGLLLRIVLAIPRHRVASSMRWVRARRISIALPRKSPNPLPDAASTSHRAHASGRLKLVLVSSSLLVLAALVTTAFWTWHSSGLMLLLR